MLTATPGWYELQNHLTLDLKTQMTIIDFENSVGGAWAKKRIHFGFVSYVPRELSDPLDRRMQRRN